MALNNTVEVGYEGKDQNWQDGETVYWFRLTGEQYGTGIEFDGDVYGVVEGSNAGFVDESGITVEPVGDHLTIAVEIALTGAVTDAMRQE